VNNGAHSTSDWREHDVERRGKRRSVEDDGDFDRDRRRKRRSPQHDRDDSDELISPEEDKDRRHETKRHSRHRYHNVDTGGRGSRRQYEEQHRSSNLEKRPSSVQDPREDEKLSYSRRRKRRRRLSSAESTTSNERTPRRHWQKDRGQQAHGERRSPLTKDFRSPRRETRPRRAQTPSDIDIGDGTTQHNMKVPAASPDSDSDPLEALVGPLPPTSKSNTVNDQPPLRSRGRGAYKPSASAMDEHFSSTYNPSLDLHPDSEPEDEKEDWDMALEALRDREIWKQKGAERLRAAGFGDEEIKKWEDSGKEKGPEDVKWTGKGEAREWDQGKVVEEVNVRKRLVGLEAAWKRKGGGFLKDFKKALR
jgi:hypothetical protein